MKTTDHVKKDNSPSVTNSMDTLSRAIDDMAGQIQCIAERLQPILCEGNEQKKECETLPACPVPLAAALDQQANNLMRLTSMLRAVSNRIAL